MKLKNFRLSDLSVSCLIQAVRKELWMVVLAALTLAMSVSLFFSWFHTPMYSGSMTYAVMSRRTSYTSGYNYNSAKEVASLLSEMMSTDMVRKQINAHDSKLQHFNGTITAEQVGATNFVVITVRDSSPERVFLALQATTEVCPRLMEYVANNSLIQVIRNPQVGASPVNNVNVRKLSVLAGIAGAGLMIFLLGWFQISRETIQTRSGARRMLAAPIIAAIPKEQSRTVKSKVKKGKKPLQVFAPTTSFAYTEQINAVCSRMEHEASTRGSKIFLFTGVGENEGKTTVAGNVAAALAIMGKRVALVDCDLRNPSLHGFFDKAYTAELPLNEMLAQPFSRESLLQCMQMHKKLKLFMLFPKTQDKRCAELLSGRTMEQLLLQLRVFDYVILDTPPIGYFSDAEALAEKADASILVVRQNTTPAPDINDHIDVLRGVKANFLGVVLNRMTASFTEGYGYGYGYGHYGYGSKSSGGKKSRSEAPKE